MRQWLSARPAARREWWQCRVRSRRAAGTRPRRPAARRARRGRRGRSRRAAARVECWPRGAGRRGSIALAPASRPPLGTRDARGRPPQRAIRRTTRAPPLADKAASCATTRSRRAPTALLRTRLLLQRTGHSSSNYEY